MKRVFKVTVGGEDKEFAALAPTQKQRQQAELVFNREVRRGVEAGLMVRKKAEQVAREQGLWNDQTQALYDGLLKKLRDGELRLAAGGIKLGEARALAVSMAEARREMRRLVAERNELERCTAEAQAEQARFNYLVAACTVDNVTGKNHFKDVDDYLSKTDDPVAFPAASAMGDLLYGLEEDYEKKLPENKFLIQYKFVDENLRYVNRDGKLVDVDGRLVDEQGRYVDTDNNPVDRDGNPLDQDGDYKVEFSPFVDDETGEPVAV